MLIVDLSVADVDKLSEIFEHLKKCQVKNMDALSGPDATGTSEHGNVRVL